MAFASSHKKSLLQSLPRGGEGLDLIKIARIVVAALLFVAAIVVDLTPLIKTLILVLAAVIVGYDLVFELIDDVLMIVSGSVFPASRAAIIRFATAWVRKNGP